MQKMARQLRTITCCLCLSEDESTFHSDSIMKSMPLHEMVDYCLGIQINANGICNECVLNISNFYTFKKKVLEAQELINSLPPKNDHINENINFEYVEDETVEELSDGMHILQEDNEINKTHTVQAETSNNRPTQTIRLIKIGGIKKRAANQPATNEKQSHKKNKIDDTISERITIQMNECLICPAILGDILQLKDHIDAHTNIKCKACNRQFARYSNLKRHFNSVHSKPKPFQCDICHLGFNFSVNLQAHAQLHYSGKIPNSACNNG